MKCWEHTQTWDHAGRENSQIIEYPKDGDDGSWEMVAAVVVPCGQGGPRMVWYWKRESECPERR
jgi:hypothetical protein